MMPLLSPLADLLWHLRRPANRGWAHIQGRVTGTARGPVTVSLLHGEAQPAGSRRVLLGEAPFDFFVRPGRYRIHLRETDWGGEHPPRELMVDVSAFSRGRLPLEIRLEHAAEIDELPRRQQESFLLPAFSPAAHNRGSIRRGILQPLAALAAGEALLSCQDEYDSARRPLLFVHGIADSPRSFARFAGMLAGSRHQPWFYCYPSGAPLSAAAHHLYASLAAAYAALRFERISIVAHSMGGLIAARCLQLLAHARQPRFQVEHFITVSTPWQGHDAARVGRIISPLLLPCWEDIASGSEFIRSLSPAAFTPETAYHLLFGFKPAGFSGFRVNGLPYARNHDGFVTLASQLDAAAQQRAATIRGFEETHRSILRSSAAAAWVRTLCAAEECAEDLRGKQTQDELQRRLAHRPDDAKHKLRMRKE